MHTFMVLVAGFLLLTVCLLAGHWSGYGAPRSALAFIPLWFLAAMINLWIGVSSAGYTVAEETPIFLLVFTVPAMIAGAIWWMARA